MVSNKSVVATVIGLFRGPACVPGATRHAGAAAATLRPFQGGSSAESPASPARKRAVPGSEDADDDAGAGSCRGSRKWSGQPSAAEIRVPSTAAVPGSLERLLS